MSCRVLNRRLEEVVLNELAYQARRVGVKKLIGHYLPTDRNAIVRGHYKQLGFSCLTEDSNATHWLLDIRSFEPNSVSMQVVRTSFHSS